MKGFHSSPGVPASRSGLDYTNSKIHLRLPSALTPFLITLTVLLATCQFIEPAHGFNSYSCLNSKPLGISSQPRIGRGAPIRTSRGQLRLSSTPDEASTAEIDLATKTEIRNIVNHLAKQSLESLLTQSEANAIADELFFASNGRSSPIFNDSSYERYVKYWNKLEQRLREETERTPADILGKDLTNRILSSLRGDEDAITNNRRGRRGTGGTGKYDPQTVKTFLESEAVNSLFSKLLYDAIFEFTVKFDFIGNFISGLPLLGPVRNQVLKESKRQLDRTLGPLVQRFLSGYTRVAIRQAVDFVVSEENASAFGKANARLVGYLLEKRTVAEWVPETETLVGWREELWAYLVGLETGNGGQEGMGKEDQKKLVEQSLRWTYDLIGDKCVNDTGLDVNEILDSSPTLEKKLGSFWQQCLESSKGTL